MKEKLCTHNCFFMVAFLFPQCSLEAAGSLNFSIIAVFISQTELKLALSNMLIELGYNEVCSLFEIRALLQAPPRHCQNGAVQLSSSVGCRSAFSHVNY